MESVLCDACAIFYVPFYFLPFFFMGLVHALDGAPKLPERITNALRRGFLCQQGVYEGVGAFAHDSHSTKSIVW
ncbi:hypothetical protein WK23_18095 [Burkholderia vietnamiensis]|nr:hypothetical protein WK23_18095 [Burkholderia vietnamiensis]KVF09633.1 hypothetical protein WJ05_17565 [Burkholderia vietnamiensis]